MKLIHLVLLLSLSLIFSINLLAQNSAPEVTNVHAEQRENTMLVDVTYDVADADNDLLFITMLASDDSGKTFNVPVAHLSDSVGFGIVPGPGKKIVWNAGEDYPEQYGDKFQVKVVAIDAPIGKFVKVPTDTFTMGNDEDLIQFKPAHTVEVSAFYVSTTEITNIQYQQFCDATARDYPGNPIANYLQNYPDYPVVNVTWFDAIAYCNWRSEIEGLEPCYDLNTNTCDTSKTGYRLPTEAEWERIARGGVFGKTYPWGTDTLQVDSCNFQMYSGPLAGKRAAFKDNRGPLPVASFNPYGFGVYDMAGNVSEWVNDWFDDYNPEIKKDPAGPETGTERGLRGGDWDNAAIYLRVFHRDSKEPDKTVNGYYRGFRIVRRVKS